MVINSAVPAKTVREFIAYAKASPGKIVMASVGNGTTPQLAGELKRTCDACRTRRAIPKCVGTMVRTRVECLFDLDGKKVLNVNISER
jgi:hypothetical protein